MKPFLRKSELIRLMLDAASRGSVVRVSPDGTIEVAPARKEQPDDLDNVRMK